MKLSFQARAYIFLFLVSLFLVIGGFGIYTSKQNTEDKMAETMVSSRLRAMAFECIAVLNVSNLKGEGHPISDSEIKEVQLIIGKLEELQKALVNGDDLYKIPDSKSPELTKQILETSPYILSAYTHLSEMIHAQKTWSIETTQLAIGQLNTYAQEMTDVTAVVLSESDQDKAWSDYSFIALIIGGFMLVFGAYFVLLKPVFKRVGVSDVLLTETQNEVEQLKARWSESLLGLHHQFRLPGFAFQQVLTKMESGNKMNVESNLLKQFESSVDFFNELVEEVRVLAEIETQAFQSQRSIIDLDRFLNSIASDINNVFGRDKCNIQIELGADLPPGLVQDQQVLHHCIIQVLSHQLMALKRTKITIRAELLNQDAGLVQLKFSFRSQDENNSKSSGATLYLEEHIRNELTQKFVEKLGGKLVHDFNQTYFTVVFETGNSIAINDVSKLKGLKAALFVDNPVNQQKLKKQLATWGVYAVPFSRVGQPEELEAVLGKFHFCISDAGFLLNQGNDVINALNRRLERQPLLFFVVCKEQDRPALTHSFIRGFLSEPISVEELMHLLLNFSSGFLKQNVLSEDSKHKSKVKLQFLVAHSDDLERRNAQKNIQVVGYSCDTASSVNETITTLGRKQFDFLLAEASFFSEANGLLSERLQMLSDIGNKMVVIQVQNGDSIERKLNGLVDQSISTQVGIKEVQSLVDEWFEV